MASSPILVPLDYLSLIAPLIGLSAIVGAAVSSVFSYVFTLKVSKKEKQIRIVEQKLDLYSYINFQLDKMRFKWDAVKEHKGDKSTEERYAYSSTKTSNELEKILSTINDKIQDRYYLFRQDILKEWVYVSTFFADKSTEERLPLLR